MFPNLLDKFMPHTVDNPAKFSGDIFFKSEMVVMPESFVLYEIKKGLQTGNVRPSVVSSVPDAVSATKVSVRIS
jgi:hypothetical protein